MQMTQEQYDALKKRLSSIEVTLTRLSMKSDHITQAHIESTQIENQSMGCPKCGNPADPFVDEVCPVKDDDCYVGLKAVKIKIAK